MKRFFMLLSSEVKLFRTAVPIHLVAILQPSAMYLLMTLILVNPTFDMNMEKPETSLEAELLEELMKVGSPIGLPYIRPVTVDWDGGAVVRQVVRVEDRSGIPTAVQYFGLIDSNLVKNYRNRLTAAALGLWNNQLGSRAVHIQQRPWLPRDVSYNVYFGMAMLTMATFLAASILGGFLTAQEYESRTIVEYRLSPASVGLILGARMVRLVLSSLLSAGVLLASIGIIAHVWSGGILRVALVLLPLSIIAGCLGMMAGLLLCRTIPAFLVGLVVTFVGWILGSSFGLAAGFGRTYECISRCMPFTHAVELLFPRYYGTTIGLPGVSALVLVCMSLGMLGITVLVYRFRILRQE